MSRRVTFKNEKENNGSAWWFMSTKKDGQKLGTVP